MQIVRRLSVTVSKQVVGDAASSVRGSKTQCRWRSFAATVPSNSAADRRKQKKVSTEERIAMVQDFVNKYRAMNGGKFPPAYAAMKEVGGGYYNVKKIVQEMQYNAKMPVDKDSVVKEVSARKAAIRKDKSNEVKLQLSSATCLEHECEDTSSIGEAEAKLQTPIAAEQMLLHEISRVSGSDNKDAAAQVLGAEVKSISHSEEPLPENNIKQKDSPMEDFNFDGRKQMDEQRHSPEPEKRTRKLSNERKADIQAESKPSLWKNMKSFADGILNMWWKQ
ncbi:uncharacterized protein [Solanum lycopersicum]|uniref:AT3G52170-like helix-turn-helix domain-containing protein n=1 Tax=Solanum lycopersicum TaxID=4081 RepID=A0A3Q7G388_SOLLC|nr:uncharacterized protein LOC101251753 isoform X1 [Solanum lycopersicum]XP_010317543.1 uncharacterized protein LOC101251753 isoform X1 [Solanum lycopersicum]XP_010317545.1 uncharacterized protein LOC101251753 isoform X1 [Solanum lycopersicum]